MFGKHLRLGSTGYATMFVDLVWLSEFLTLVSDLKAIYDQLSELMTEPDPDLEFVELSDADRLQALKDATLLVARLRLNIACYPLGTAAVVFYDTEGAPIPLECLEGVD